MKLKYCLLVLLWPVINVYAQSPPHIHPLRVGDTLPDIIFCDVYNHPVSKIQLSDLKGKLVILDFWGKYCAPCILALPKLDSLQQAFKNQVQVITISDFSNQHELRTTLGRFKRTKHLKLPVLLANELLSQYFPHLLVSHVVWIDGNGVVKAITGSDYVTKDNIQTMLSGTAVNWPVKNDLLDFDFKKPLLALEHKDIPSPSFLYYSTLTSHLEGISAPNGTFPDSAKKISLTNYYNATLLSLCEIALNHPPDGRIILNVKDTGRYKWNWQILYSDWYRTNTYCYSIKQPLGLTETEIKKNVQADLIRWLNILGIQITLSKKIKGGKELSFYTITDKN